MVGHVHALPANPPLRGSRSITDWIAVDDQPGWADADRDKLVVTDSNLGLSAPSARVRLAAAVGNMTGAWAVADAMADVLIPQVARSASSADLVQWVDWWQSSYLRATELTPDQIAAAKAGHWWPPVSGCNRRNATGNRSEAHPMMLVIDLEATCDDADGLPASDMEIIEIGAVWATAEGTVLDTFQALVRPVVRPQLTPFCRQLTNIQQADVDGAELFPLSQQGWPASPNGIRHRAQRGAVGANSTPSSLPATASDTASRTRSQRSSM
jgi:hypothetical protein